jgi:hypothetical protein
VSALGIVNREAATSDERHDSRTANAAMSTLMRTLRNLRKIGIKVRTSTTPIDTAILTYTQEYGHQMAVRSHPRALTSARR